MAVKQVTLVDTLDFAPNGRDSIALERSGIITDLELLTEFQVDAAATVTPAEDALARIIKGLIIRDGQGRTWFNVLDGRQLHWYNYLVYQGQVVIDAPPPAGAVDVVMRALWHIHFGVNPLNPYDPSSGIPAPEIGELALDVVWGTAADLGSGYTIDWGKITVAQSTILVGDQYDKVRPTLLLPQTRCERYAIVAGVPELGVERELPTGGMLFRTLIMVVDADETRMDAPADKDVTEVGYKMVPEAKITWRRGWLQLEYDNQSRYALSARAKGVGIINWSQIAMNAALDLRTRQRGYDLLAFTTVDTGGAIYIFHLSYVG